MIYRIFYSADEAGPTCNIYSYPIHEEKNTYYTIITDPISHRTKRIKKEDINIIKPIDSERTAYVVYTMDLENKDQLIVEMVKKVSNNAYLKVQRYQKIYRNSIHCEPKMIDMSEW